MPKHKKTGAILCPNCGKLINADAKVCIHCGHRNPSMWGLYPYLRALFGSSSTFVPLIISVCVFFYVLSLLIDPSAILKSHGFFEILSPSMQSLDRLGMTGTYAMFHGRWWTLVTAIYLHGSLLHILFNMLWTRQLGSLTEELFGTSRLLVIFTISGVFGFIVSNLLGVPFTIGASGSIFGLLGALVYYGRRRGGTFGSAMYRQMGTWAIILFLFGFFMPGVNNFAHAGGFLAGYISATILGFNEIKKETGMHRLLGLLMIIITVLCFALAIFNF